MPPTRTFFVISTPNGEDEFMCFHDQVSRIVARDGHALILLISGAEFHLPAFTVRDAIQKLFVPVYGGPGTERTAEDVSRLN